MSDYSNQSVRDMLVAGFGLASELSQAKARIVELEALHAGASEDWRKAEARIVELRALAKYWKGMAHEEAQRRSMKDVRIVELEATMEEMRTTETTLIPEERAILDAMAKATQEDLEDIAGGSVWPACEIELARRADK